MTKKYQDFKENLDLKEYQDPNEEQRVDRHRMLGTTERDVSPRKSRDFDRMISPNTSVEFKVEEGKPLDWAVLMGTNERKVLIKSGALRKDDPTYEEVKDIIAHCRKADKPSPEVLALLPPEDSQLPPPKDPEDSAEPSFKRKISKLMLGLKSILENNAERQVKYVSFKQRCNLHTKDLEGILARRALATMAYSHGAINSSHLDYQSFSAFLRAFWAENPHRSEHPPFFLVVPLLRARACVRSYKSFCNNHLCFFEANSPTPLRLNN